MTRPTKEELMTLYKDNDIRSLAKLLQTKTSTVRDWLDSYNIDKTHHTSKNKLNVPPKDELRGLYEDDRLSTTQLAKHYDTSPPTIRKWLSEYNIPKRNHKEACLIHSESQSIFPIDKETFAAQYDTMTHRELRDLYKVSNSTLFKWRDLYEIPERTYSEACIIAKRNAFELNKRIPKDTLIALYQKYGSLSSLVDNTDISKRTAKRLFEEYGIEIENPSRSAMEVELYNYCKSIRPDVDWISNDKTIISPFELDIYSPQLKIAIEYNGLYWHSEYNGNKEKSYHQMKQVKCQQKDIQLLTVFEYDDIKKVKGLISYKIKNTQDKIYARNTNVSALDNQTAMQFHNRYHIHNNTPASVHLGLFSNGQLVQVMSLSKTRFSQNYEWECARNTIGDIKVVGGTSKLFKHFIRNYNPKSIVSYADLRFGDGSVYYHSEFKRTHNSSPNYWYFKPTEPTRVYSRIKFQKHKLKKLYNDGILQFYDGSLTEFENMVNNGYDRIHDCGNAVWVWET